MKTAYEYAIAKTAEYLKKPLKTTSLRPHISVAVDKSTPHRETNHAILLLMPVNGRRIAMPLDCPPVYSVDPVTRDIVGGCGEHLAEQIIDVLKKKVSFTPSDLHYIRGINNKIIHFLSVNLPSPSTKATKTI